MTDLAAAAVLLAQRGYRVFPVGPDKAPRTARGHLDGSSVPETVRKWQWEGGGIGLVIPERTFVLDVDPRNGGDATLEAAVGYLGHLPATRTVKTQSGGRHFYFVLPDGRELRSSLGPGIDIKKPGRGYVLVPPSPGYSFLRGGDPAPAPEWLLEELTQERRPEGSASAPKYFPFQKGTGYGLAALEGELETVRSTGEGGRRATLNRVAFKLATLVAGGELDEDHVLEQLLEAALDIGLDEHQALTRIRSGWQAGLENPRGAAA